MILNVRIDEGDGPPLVLLHGWPQHGGMWRAVVPALSKRFRCIAPDLRGLGDSPKPDGPYDKRTLAADVLETLDDLGIDRARFIGHDWGAVVTSIIAREHPERMVKGIMLSIPAPWDRRPDPRKLVGIAHMPIMASPLGATLAPRLGKSILRGSGIPEAEAEDYVATMREPEGAHAAASYYRTFLLKELVSTVRDAAGRPDVPLKVIGGDRDPVCRYSELDVKVPGANHFIVDNHPELIVEHAEAFL